MIAKYRSSEDSSKPYEAVGAEFRISEVICKTCKYPEREGHTESPHHKSNVFYKTERETILEKIRSKLSKRFESVEAWTIFGDEMDADRCKN